MPCTMDILVVSPRAELWQSLRPQFEKHDAVLSLACNMDDALNSLNRRRPALVVLDINADNAALRHAVFQVLSIDAMIHTAAVTSMTPESFHDAMEGLGMLAGLPSTPTPADIDALMDALAKVEAK